MNKYTFAVSVAEKIGFSETALGEVKSVMELILSKAEDRLTEIEKHLVQKTTDDAEVHALANYLGIDRDMGMLAVTLLLTEQSRHIYAERGIPERIFMDTMKNIWVACQEYAHDNNGKYGMTRYGFVRRNLYGDVLRHGRLEYEIETFAKENYTVCGVTVHTGDPILKIHIPSNEPLLLEDAEESFRLAYRYYRLAPQTPFMCHSWLIYPGNRNFCRPESNIIRFLECFEVLESEDCPKCGDLWRIFGRHADFDHPETFSETTSLQRSLKAYLLRGGTMGMGYGIFLHDGEKRLLRENQN